MKFKSFRRFLGTNRSTIYLGDYRSFDEALAAVPDTGYESSSSVVEHYISGYRQIADIANNRHSEPDMFRRLVPIMAALSLCAPVRRVVDFGGSYGEYYHRLRWLNPNFDPLWDIVETQSVCAAASELGANERKRFFPNLNALDPGRVDLVVVSGTLQYLPDPLAAIEAVFSIGSPIVVFSRLPVAPKLSSHRVTIQRPTIMAASFPMWFFGSKIFDEIGQYARVLFDFTIPEDNVNLDGKSFPMSGCVTRRETNRWRP